MSYKKHVEYDDEPSKCNSKCTASVHRNAHPASCFTHHTATLNDYYHDLKYFWKTNHEGQLGFEVWSRVVDYASQLAEAVRKEEMSDVAPQVANTFIWILSFIAKTQQYTRNTASRATYLDKAMRIAKGKYPTYILNFITKGRSKLPQIDPLKPIGRLNSPWELLWNKIPGICPACLQFAQLSVLKKDIVLSDERGANEYFESMEKHDSMKKDYVKRIMESKELKKISPVRVGPIHVFPCTCLSRNDEAENRNKRYKHLKNVFNKGRLIFAKYRPWICGESPKKNMEPPMLAMWQIDDMIGKIFSSKYSVWSLETIAFHFLEEVGEASQSIRDCACVSSKHPSDLMSKQSVKERLENVREAVEEELADIFSWLWALVWKIRRTYFRDAQQMRSNLDILCRPMFNDCRGFTLPFADNSTEKQQTDNDWDQANFAAERICSLPEFLWARHSEPEIANGQVKLKRSWLWCNDCAELDDNKKDRQDKCDLPHALVATARAFLAAQEIRKDPNK